MCSALSDLRHPMPSRDWYPCKDCRKRYPACQDKCTDMAAAKKANAKRKVLERKNKEIENAATEYSIRRNFAAARKKVKER